MKYSKLPTDLGFFDIESREMMCYVYLPVKFPGGLRPIYEKRLDHFQQIIGCCVNDFISMFGMKAYRESYMYITAKALFQSPGKPINRPGWHSDGFMTDDINYIWSDHSGTLFNSTKMNLTMDDDKSLVEMENNIRIDKTVFSKDGHLYRLDQYCIHKPNDFDDLASKVRRFFKMSFSKDKYDLIGNSHNYELQYDWEMRERLPTRNMPQK